MKHRSKNQKRKSALPSFVDLLTQIFIGKWDGYVNVPLRAVPRGSRILGTMADPMAQALFSESCAHMAFSDSVMHDEHTDGLIDRMERRAEILESLFWKMVESRYPITIRPDAKTSITAGWQVAIKKYYQVDDLLPEGHISRNVMTRIAHVFADDQVNVGSYHPHGALEKGEKVIGVTQDQRVKALHSLCCELLRTKSEIVGPKNNEDKTMWFRKKEFGFVEDYFLLKDVLGSQASLVRDIMGEIIHDEFPETGNHYGNLALREGWKVVVLPATD